MDSLLISRSAVAEALIFKTIFQLFSNPLGIERPLLLALTKTYGVRLLSSIQLQYARIK